MLLLHMVHARCNVHVPTVMIRNVSSRKSVKQKTLSLVTFVYLCQQEHTGNMRTLVVSALFVGWSAGRSNFSGKKIQSTILHTGFILVFSSIRSYIQKLKIFFINPNVQFPVYLGSALRFRLRLLNYFYNQYLSETRDRTRGI